MMHPWLNWIEHLTTDQKVGGSSPFERASKFAGQALSGFG